MRPKARTAPAPAAHHAITWRGTHAPTGQHHGREPERRHHGQDSADVAAEHRQAVEQDAGDEDSRSRRAAAPAGDAFEHGDREEQCGCGEEAEREVAEAREATRDRGRVAEQRVELEACAGQQVDREQADDDHERGGDRLERVPAAQHLESDGQQDRRDEYRDHERDPLCTDASALA